MASFVDALMDGSLLGIGQSEKVWRIASSSVAESDSKLLSYGGVYPPSLEIREKKEDLSSILMAAGETVWMRNPGGLTIVRCA